MMNVLLQILFLTSKIMLHVDECVADNKWYGSSQRKHNIYTPLDYHKEHKRQSENCANNVKKELPQAISCLHQLASTVKEFKEHKDQTRTMKHDKICTLSTELRTCVKELSTLTETKNTILTILNTHLPEESKLCGLCKMGKWGTANGLTDDGPGCVDCGFCRGGEMCDQLTGQCPNGCEVPHTGELCLDGVPCPSGFWGEEINITITKRGTTGNNVPDGCLPCGHCSQGHCNPRSGVCPQKKCKQFWTGPRCLDRAPCPQNMWGEIAPSNESNEAPLGCIMCGHCKNGKECDKTNGICTNGCATPYVPDFCVNKEPCPDGSWGERGIVTDDFDANNRSFPLGCNECGNCIDGEACDKKSGACHNGCDAEWQGQQCFKRLRCPNNTWGMIVHGSNETDKEIPLGCTKCGHCKLGTCDYETGICKGVRSKLESQQCKYPYHGDRCDLKVACPSNTWGDIEDSAVEGDEMPAGCSPCGHCLNDAECDPQSGNCPYNKCHELYTGERCNQMKLCDKGSWGFIFIGPRTKGGIQPGCKKCGKCSHGVCDAKTGICPGKKCRNLFKGDLCTEKHACPENTWGEINEKSKQSNESITPPGCFPCGQCKLGTKCDKMTGVCPKGCTEVYQGMKCTDKLPCPPKTWGELADNYTAQNGIPSGCHECGHCAADALCDVESGKCPKGCMWPWQGDTCNTLLECPAYSWGSRTDPTNTQYNGTKEEEESSAVIPPGCIKCGHCINKLNCDRQTGECPNKKCIYPWTGPKCDEKELCPDGSWGIIECDVNNVTLNEDGLPLGCFKCGHCKNRTPCNKIIGTCPDGCQYPYTGDYCDKPVPCKNGTWGSPISKVTDEKDDQAGCTPCGYCKEKPCDSNNGFCKNYECEDGWMNERCTETDVCPNNTWGSKMQSIHHKDYNNETGLPGGCQRCGHCLNGEECERETGFCPNGCESPFKGSRCYEISSCPIDSWGNISKMEVINETMEPSEFPLGCQPCGHCKEKKPCNYIDGKCPNGCEQPWTGIRCMEKEPCPKGSWGQQAMTSDNPAGVSADTLPYGCLPCGHCANGADCDRTTGICKRCQYPWQGSHCIDRKHCPAHSWGELKGAELSYTPENLPQGCMNCGHCKNNVSCDRVSGTCPDKICEWPWKGPRCTEKIPCPLGFYGEIPDTASDESGDEETTLSGENEENSSSGETKENSSPGVNEQNGCKRCGNCSYGIACDQITGVCPTGCEYPYTGEHCNIKSDCPYGTWGSRLPVQSTEELLNRPVREIIETDRLIMHKIKRDGDEDVQHIIETDFNPPAGCSECGKCLVDMCNPVTGVCEEGCQLPYTGDKCTEKLQCPPQTWGERVMADAAEGGTEELPNGCTPCGHCADNTACDPQSGVCPAGCQDDYGGELCSIKNGTCPPKHWRSSNNEQTIEDNYCIPCGKCANSEDCDISDGHCPTGCQSPYTGDLCEEIDKCPSGTWGSPQQSEGSEGPSSGAPMAIGCTPCGHCADDEPCDSATGKCKACTAPWEGEHCTEMAKCPDLYWGTLNENDESRLTEHDYPDNIISARGCTKCGFCVDQACDRKTGICGKGCIPPYYGEWCRNKPPCPDGYWGTQEIAISNPQSNPNNNLTAPNGCLQCGACANNDSCNNETGECPNGCETGWAGNKCSEIKECGKGMWRALENQYLANDGPISDGCIDCGQCNDNAQCDQTTGKCPNGCKDSWQGERCTERVSCPSGTWGTRSELAKAGEEIPAGCIQCGFCKEQACNQENGSCPSDCQEGYKGDLCNVLSVDPSCSKGEHQKCEPCSTCSTGTKCRCVAMDCTKILLGIKETCVNIIRKAINDVADISVKDKQAVCRGRFIIYEACLNELCECCQSKTDDEFKDILDDMNKQLEAFNPKCIEKIPEKRQEPDSYAIHAKSEGTQHTANDNKKLASGNKKRESKYDTASSDKHEEPSQYHKRRRRDSDKQQQTFFDIIDVEWMQWLQSGDVHLKDRPQTRLFSASTIIDIVMPRQHALNKHQPLINDTRGHNNNYVSSTYNEAQTEMQWLIKPGNIGLDTNSFDKNNVDRLFLKDLSEDTRIGIQADNVMFASDHITNGPFIRQQEVKNTDYKK